MWHWVGVSGEEGRVCHQQLEKRDKGGGGGGGERDTIWLSRTESQQSQTKIERKGRRGRLRVTGVVCRKVGRKRNQDRQQQGMGEEEGALVRSMHQQGPK